MGASRLNRGRRRTDPRNNQPGENPSLALNITVLNPMKRQREEAGPLLRSALTHWAGHLCSGGSAIAVSARLPTLLASTFDETSANTATEGGCSGRASGASAHVCRSCAMVAVCSACVEACHSGHVIEPCSDANWGWEGCACGAGTQCLLLTQGRGIVPIDGSNRSFLSGLIQGIVVLGMPAVVGQASRMKSMLTAGADADGFVHLHRMVRAIQVAADAASAAGVSLPPLPNLANTAGVLALSPFFRLSKLGSRSRVALAPRHPCADVVLAAAARHVRDALVHAVQPDRQLDAFSLSAAAAILQSRFIGILALDRVIEPAALLWAALLLERPVGFSETNLAGALIHFCAAFYQNPLASAGESKDASTDRDPAFDDDSVAGFLSRPQAGPGPGPLAVPVPASRPCTASGAGTGPPAAARAPAASTATASGSGRRTGTGSLSGSDIMNARATGIHGVLVTFRVAMPDSERDTVTASASGTPGTGTRSDLTSSSWCQWTWGDTALRLGVGGGAATATSSSSALATGHRAIRTASDTGSVLLGTQRAAVALAIRATGIAGRLVFPTGSAGSASSEFLRRQQEQTAWGFSGGFSRTPSATGSDDQTLAHDEGDSTGQPAPACLAPANIIDEGAFGSTADASATSPKGNGRLPTTGLADSPPTMLLPAAPPSAAITQGDELDLALERRRTPRNARQPPSASIHAQAAPGSEPATTTVLDTVEGLETWAAAHLSIDPCPLVVSLRVRTKDLTPADSETVAPPGSGLLPAGFRVSRKDITHVALSCARLAPADTITAVIDVRAMIGVDGGDGCADRRARVGRALSPALANPSVLKVTHAGVETVMWLAATLGVYLCHALDTHIALDEAVAAAASASSAAPPPPAAPYIASVTAAELRTLEYSDCLAVQALTRGSGPGDLAGEVHRLRDLPEALRFAGLSTQSTSNDDAQLHGVMAAEAEALLQLAALSATAAGVRVAGLSTDDVACAATSDECATVPQALIACRTALWAAGNITSQTTTPPALPAAWSRSTWARASLRSELQCLRAPPFDAFHGRDVTPGGSDARAGPPAIIPPWYVRCSSCGSAGHFAEACRAAP